MKFSALALDYDGTIAVNGVFDPAVRDAIGEVRRRGVVVVLVTGRRLDDLHQVAGDLNCFDAVVGENGAVLEFPASGRRTVLGHRPPPHFLRELEKAGVPFAAGESVVEMDARWAGATLEIIRRLELPLILTFNRGRLMILPQSIGKSTGLRQALLAHRISIHNTVGIGDAVVMVTRETDPDEVAALLALCRPAPCTGVSPALFRDLQMTEAALLPGVDEACGHVRRFQLAPRLTAHVRHRAKYLDMPVIDSQAFVFTDDGHAGPHARTLKEFVLLLTTLPSERIAAHLRRHDFSHWIAGVFRDPELTNRLHDVEDRVQADDVHEIADAVAQTIRARYETAPDAFAI